MGASETGPCSADDGNHQILSPLPWTCDDSLGASYWAVNRTEVLWPGAPSALTRKKLKLEWTSDKDKLNDFKRRLRILMNISDDLQSPIMTGVESVPGLHAHQGWAEKYITHCHRDSMNDTMVFILQPLADEVSRPKRSCLILSCPSPTSQNNHSPYYQGYLLEGDFDDK